MPRYLVIGKLEPDGNGMVPNDQLQLPSLHLWGIREYRRHQDPRSYVAEEMKLRRGQNLRSAFLVQEHAVKN